MHVIRRRPQIVRRRFIDHLRLVASAKEMPAVMVAPVKAHRVGAQEPFHSRHQIGMRRFYDEMEMIAHQTVGMAPAIASRHRRRRAFPRREAGPLIDEKCPAAELAAHDVIDRVCVLDSKRSAIAPSRRQAKMCQSLGLIPARRSYQTFETQVVEHAAKRERG